MSAQKVTGRGSPEQCTKKVARPRHGYNLFFMMQRQRLLNDDTTTGSQPFTPEEIRKFAEYQHSIRDLPKPKRKHRKSHGRYGFSEIATIIAKMWRSIDPSLKLLFERYGEMEREIYNREQASMSIDKTPSPVKTPGVSARECVENVCNHSNKLNAIVACPENKTSYYQQDSLQYHGSQSLLRDSFSAIPSPSFGTCFVSDQAKRKHVLQRLRFIEWKMARLIKIRNHSLSLLGKNKSISTDYHFSSINPRGLVSSLPTEQRNYLMKPTDALYHNVNDIVDETFNTVQSFCAPWGPQNTLQTSLYQSQETMNGDILEDEYNSIPLGSHWNYLNPSEWGSSMQFYQNDHRRVDDTSQNFESCYAKSGSQSMSQLPIDRTQPTMNDKMLEAESDSVNFENDEEMFETDKVDEWF